VVTKKDMILYALGIGFQEDPLNKEHYNFTYEGAEDFQAFPKMPVVVGHKFEDGIGGIPGVPEFNPMSLLHGEEVCEIFQPHQEDTTVIIEEKLIDLQDKSSSKK
jgi:hypothetical protein